MSGTPSYWAILPANVRYDKRLCPMAKIIYAEITALQDAKGYAWPSNGYFATLYEVGPGTVGEWVKQLISAGHIGTKMIKVKDGSARIIWLTETLAKSEGSPEKAGEGEGGSPEKAGEGSPEKAGGNTKELNTKVRRAKKAVPSRPPLPSVEPDFEEKVWIGELGPWVKHWQEVYPNIDVNGELFNALEYAIAHPEKQYKKWFAFISNWMRNANGYAEKRGHARLA